MTAKQKKCWQNWRKDSSQVNLFSISEVSGKRPSFLFEKINCPSFTTSKSPSEPFFKSILTSSIFFLISSAKLAACG